MDGILTIDKPAGITSHDVVARVRRVLKIKRVGHTGTLDPFATGVMVVLVGQATRLAQFLDKDEKEYEALIQFGSETDTGDHTGLRTADCGLGNEEIAERLADANWSELLKGFSGTIEQTPPMYSAKKVDGKKLYEMARKGQEIERKAASVTIREIELLDAERLRTSDAALRTRIVCSAGTYIRTLAEDIGRAVGVGAHLAELRRTRAGKFAIAAAVTLEELGSVDDPRSMLIPMSEAVSHLPEVRLSDERIAKTKSGLSSRIEDNALANGETVRIADPSGVLIAIGHFNAEENSVQPKIVLG
ncbi:MAG: tRNA pseudouridine(55) synthase TruB [Acidobacteria bacterium]|nr:tRNA pseudouridine(55) synthase TruB [Acidobacteriota bacterium]